MEKFTLNICTSSGTVDMWRESDNIESLKLTAYETISRHLPQLEEGEFIQACIMHTSDLQNRVKYIPQVWSIEATNQVTQNRFWIV